MGWEIPASYRIIDLEPIPSQCRPLLCNVDREISIPSRRFMIGKTCRVECFGYWSRISRTWSFWLIDKWVDPFLKKDSKISLNHEIKPIFGVLVAKRWCYARKKIKNVLNPAFWWESSSPLLRFLLPAADLKWNGKSLIIRAKLLSHFPIFKLRKDSAYRLT